MLASLKKILKDPYIRPLQFIVRMNSKLPLSIVILFLVKIEWLIRVNCIVHLLFRPESQNFLANTGFSATCGEISMQK
jgi:hypothetical protein